MNTTNLKSFCAIVDLGSFSKAAQKMNCSQAAISKQIQSLEKELHYPLFTRNGKIISLNPSGKIVYEYGRRILDEVLAMQEKLFRANRNSANLITLGTTDALGMYVLPSLLTSFKSANPDCAISLNLDFFPTLLQILLLGEISFAVLPDDPLIHNHPALELLPLRGEQLVLVLAPQHPLAKKAQLTFTDLQTTRLLVTPDHSETRQSLKARLAQQQVTLEQVREFTNIAALKKAVAAGEGPAFLPSYAVTNELQSGSLITRPVKQFPEAYPLYFVKRKHAEFSRAENSFVSFAQGSKLD